MLALGLVLSALGCNTVAASFYLVERRAVLEVAGGTLLVLGLVAIGAGLPPLG